MQTPTPILLVGAGHMGGALIQGWLACGAVQPRDLLIRDPSPGQAALGAARGGAELNPPDTRLRAARTVVLGLKPQIWASAAPGLAPHISPGATIISIMAGVRAEDLATAFAGRPVARVMPTTAAAVCKGSACVWSDDPAARALARSLFAGLGVVVDLSSEAQIHAATAASGSAPAYVYAFVESLEAAAAHAGLDELAARTLSRAAMIGAAALLESTGEDAKTLRAQVTSPNGTTEAALRILLFDGALARLIEMAVTAAAARSRELGGEA